MAERMRTKEREKKRLELSRFSYNLSSVLLEGQDGKVGADISPEIVTLFHNGSVADRNAYWGEKAPSTSFAKQMTDWLGDEKNGIAQWVGKQTDNDVVAMLTEVGLKGDPTTTKQDLQNPRVARVIAAINSDLEKAGESPLDANSLSDDKARSLIFYANYLSGEKGADDTKSFIDVLTAVAQERSNGNTNEAIATLQKVAPLLSITGEEAQYALGALLVAKTHAVSARDMLEKANPNAGPESEEELRVFKFFQNIEHDANPVTPLEQNKPYQVTQVLQELQPEPTPEGPYWIGKDIPADFAEKLTDEQLRELELRETFFVPGKGKGQHFPNEKVFPQAKVLQHDQRFENAEALTYNDSGLFALAAASAETPEKQAALYRQLGETVLRVHTQNPELLEEFLKAQSEDSAEHFASNDYFRAYVEINKRFATVDKKPLMEKLSQRLPGVDLSDQNALAQLTEEQRKIFGETVMEEQLPIQKEVMGSLQQFPDRLVAVNITMSDEHGFDEEINIPNTITAWPERVKALQEALQKEPLTLTIEQIRQIEFLAHSVNTAKVMELLGATGAIAQPVETQPNPESGEQAEQDRTHMKLEEFFEEFNNLEEQVPETILPRRDTMIIDDSSRMMVFPSAMEDASRFEITNDRGELEVYTISPNEQNAIEPLYNIRSPFFAQLLQENSLSLHSLRELNKVGHGRNLLLAYVLEASGDAKQRTTLLTNLFQELGDIYTNHPGLAEKIASYFEGVNEKAPFNEIQDVKRLLGSSETATHRIAELNEKLKTNQDITMQDLRDMGVYALPFDLQYIAARMKEKYERTTETQPTPPQAE